MFNKLTIIILNGTERVFDLSKHRFYIRENEIVVDEFDTLELYRYRFDEIRCIIPTTE